MPPPVVQVATPLQRDVTDFQVFTARTQAIESVDIKARVTGYLMKFDFKDGDMVKKDQVLFEIDDRPYKAALDEANAQVQLQKASLVKAQANLDIALDANKLAAGAVSQQEVNLRTGSRDIAKAALAAAQANVETAQLNYNWCKVTSPISGRINQHFVDVGNLVTQDTTLLTNIVSIQPMWAYFNVDENTALRCQKLITEGKLESVRKGHVPVAMSLSGESDYPWEGTVDFVSNQVDPNTGSIRVRAVFPNEKGLLLAGLFGRVRVPVSAPHKALLVQDEAIGQNQDQKYVLIVNDKNVAEYHPVSVGQLHGGLREVFPTIQVLNGNSGVKDTEASREVLKPTDRIIVNGLLRVRPGATVDPQLVDMQTLMPADTGPATKGKSK